MTDQNSGNPVICSSAVSISDEPRFAHRGLMIDTGRRFFPVPLVENLLDTMAAIKLNVLHLHASDFCRWSVESKLYPNRACRTLPTCRLPGPSCAPPPCRAHPA